MQPIQVPVAVEHNKTEIISNNSITNNNNTISQNITISNKTI